MEITLEKKDKVNASLKINLKEADYKPKYSNKLKEYGKKVQLKGFRTGHVPSALIEKMYGKSILVEEINGMISQTISTYLKDNNVEILGDPMPEAKEMATIDWDNQKDFNFTYNLGLAPEFSLELSDKVSVTKYTIEYTDKVGKETIENLRKQFGVYSDTEVTVAEDIIYAEAIDASGKSYKCIMPEFRIDEPAKSKFIGLKVGDKVSADIRTVLSEDASIAYVLGVEKKEAEHIKGNFDFVIERISHPSLAELNEDFYKKVLRNDEVKTFEDFEAKVKENIVKSYSIESRNALFSDIFEFYTKNSRIDLPSMFLKEWLLFANENKLTKDQIEEQYPSFEIGLKWDLIKNKIAKDFDLKIDNSDVLNKAKAMVKAQFGMQEETVLDEQMEKMVENWADSILKRDNGKEYRKIFDEVYAEKVLDLIVSKIKVKEDKVDIEKFRELQAKNK